MRQMYFPWKWTLKKSQSVTTNSQSGNTAKQRLKKYYRNHVSPELLRVFCMHALSIVNSVTETYQERWSVAIENMCRSFKTTKESMVTYYTLPPLPFYLMPSTNGFYTQPLVYLNCTLYNPSGWCLAYLRLFQTQTLMVTISTTVRNKQEYMDKPVLARCGMQMSITADGEKKGDSSASFDVRPDLYVW